MKKKFKIGIAIILTVVAVGAGAGIIAWNYIPKKATIIRKNLNAIADDVDSYFIHNTSIKPLWFYKNGETPWRMNYEAKSLKIDNSNKDQLIVKIDIKAIGSTVVSKSIDIKLNWANSYNYSQNVIWNQMTNEINYIGYHNNSDSISGNDIIEYINEWISTSDLKWYETINNHQITFTTSTDIMINNDGAFIVKLKPSTTVDGNEDIFLKLKWLIPKDENTDEIISAIKASGYSNQPVLISSMVEKYVNDYLANITWVVKNSKQTLYKFISTKVIKNVDSTWSVTLDENTSLKTRNMSFFPFNITLDWKNEEDTTAKIKEVDSEIESNNYDKEISSATVLAIFKQFLENGDWRFSYIGTPAQKVDIKMDPGFPNGGITFNPSADYAFELHTTFDFIITGRGGEPHTFIFKNQIDINWKYYPPSENIYNDVMNQYNKNGHYKFIYYTPHTQ